MSQRKIIGFFLIFLSLIFSAAASDRHKIVSEKEQAEVINAWQKWRLENILPALMRRTGIDMWLVMNREYMEDPVYFTLVARPVMYSGGQVVLIFHDRGPQQGVELLCSAPHGIPGYKNIWRPRVKTQMENLADFIRERNPERIGVNISSTWPLADGLTASQREKLEKGLGPELAGKLVSAEDLCVGWLESRSPQEMNVYRHICGIAHDLIAEFFSNKVITPDITTAEDVEWWIRQRITGLGLGTWFQPSIDIVRSDSEAAKHPERDTIIRRGDVLHCDVGIIYLGLCTDMQWQAYVLKNGETEVPAGIQRALDNANRMADIFMAEFRTGRTGKEIRDITMEKLKAEGLKGLIYTHPLGFYGHAAGCTPDGRDPKTIDEGNMPKWDYPLYLNTVYSIEFSCTTPVPEWGGQELRIGFEEDAAFTENGCRFIDGRQTKFLIIR